MIGNFGLIMHMGMALVVGIAGGGYLAIRIAAQGLAKKAKERGYVAESPEVAALNAVRTPTGL
jgi:hypothetical protein